MEKEINVGGVETFSMVDYPGKLAAVVFMQGCPWRCPFCHNTELQKIGKASGFEWKKFVDFLKERQGKLDAVVFSGGEPLVQNSLPAAIEDVKKLGYKIGLHTGGYRSDFFKKVLPQVDWVGFDIKTPLNEEQYNKAVGQKHFKEVVESLKALLQSGKAYECRTTCDPRLLSVNDIYAISKELKSLGVKEYYLQKYRPIETDSITQEEDCEKFFTDKKLLEHLKESFSVFDVRK